MNTMLMSALTALGIAGIFGAVQSTAMDDCCAKPREACCSPKPDNCCEKMHQDMKDHHPSGTGRNEEKPAGESHCGAKVQPSGEHGGHQAACGEKHGEGSGCMK